MHSTSARQLTYSAHLKIKDGHLQDGRYVVALMCFAYPALGAAKPGQLEKDPLRDASKGAPVVLMVPLSDEVLDAGHMPARSRQGNALI